jgi:ubiquitin-protein ligase
VLKRLEFVLLNPNDGNPLNATASQMFQKDKEGFKKKIEEMYKKA